MAIAGRCLHLWVHAVLISGLTVPCLAQELEPRRWTHLPIDSNYAAAGYAYTDGTIAFEPVLRIEGAQMTMNTWTAGYIRTFELFGKSARVDLKQGYQEGRWSGTVDGMATTVRREGWSDSVVRLAIDLYGAPPLKGKAFAEYRAATKVETIVGAGLVMQLPTGEYIEDKLINLGSNRFTFRPQLGVVHNRDDWSFEATGSVWLFTENDEFFGGNRLEQDPLYTIQGHVVYTFRPGFWAGASAGYGFGGESSVNGVASGDYKENVGWALSLGYPIMPWLGVKAAYYGVRTQVPVGSDSDTFAFGLSAFW